MNIPLHPEYYQGKKFKSPVEMVLFKMFRNIGNFYCDAYDKKYTKDKASSEISKIFKSFKGLDQQVFCKLNADENLIRASIICEKCHRSEDFKNYKVNKNFLGALSRMDVEIREELLPEKIFAGYFAFEPGILKDIDGYNVIGAYVYTKRVNLEDGEVDQHFSDSHVIFRATLCTTPEKYPIELTFGDPSSIITGVRFGQKFTEVINDLSEYVKKEYPEDSPPSKLKAEVEEKTYRTLINLVMYLHSLQPDVQHLKPVHLQTANEKKAQQRAGIELNNTTMPLVLVSWNYGKGIEYSKEHTVVRSHLRWQPCGPGFSQTRLVIVKEHERHFKNLTPDATLKAEVEP